MDKFINKFSLFKGPISNLKPLKEATTADVFTIITSTDYKSVTDKLRTLTGKDKGKYKGATFDYATFSGTFTNRADASLKVHSGLICIDIDHIGNLQAVSATRERVLKDFTPELMFVSPSGDGLKVVYRIAISEGTHLEYYNACINYFQKLDVAGIDPSCTNVSRACFLPHDPQCHYTDSPTMLDRSFIDTFSKMEETIKIYPQPEQPKTNTRILIDRAVNMVNNATDGNKHFELLKASRLIGGYVVSGGVDEQEAITALENAIKSRDIDNFPAAQKTIRDGIEHGKKEPIITLRANDASKTGNIIDPEKKTDQQEKIPLLPIDGLPDFMQKLIIECERVYGTHRDLWAGAFIASTALAIGQSQQLKGKYENATVLWMALVAPSGMGKTEPLSIAFKPFHKIDAEKIKEFEKLLKEYENIKAMNKKERAEAGITSIPEMPICVQHILADATPEAVIQANKNNIRGINILRDELHGWLLDIGRYSKSGEVQNWLSAWSQSPMTVNRKGSSPIKLEHPFINITGGLQPELLPELAKDHRAVNGFMQRFCFVFPDNVFRPEYRSNQLSDSFKTTYSDYITNLLSLTGHCDSVVLSIEAQSIYETFVNKNVKIINAEKTEYLRALAAKMDVIALRLALIVHFSKWACTSVDDPNITPETMRAAIDIAEYFRATGHKVYNCLMAGNSGMNVKDVAKFLKGKGASQNEIATALKVSQPYINKILKD